MNPTDQIIQYQAPTIQQADSGNRHQCDGCCLFVEVEKLRRFEGRAILCLDCIEHRIQAQRAHRRRCYEALCTKGYLRDNFAAAGFGRSKPEVESMNPEAWAKAREWNGRSNIFVYGPVGVGKSFLGLSVLQREFNRTNGRDVAEISARRIAKLSDRFDEGRGLIADLSEVHMLLLDDIDKAVWNPERLSALWEILDDRMVGNRRTIITANVAPAQLSEMLKAQCAGNTSLVSATLDRLKPCLTLELKGRSLR